MKNSCVTLDITSSDVRVVSIESGKITKWKSEPLPEGLLKAGTITEPQPVSIIIDNLFKNLGLSRKKVICCITGLPFIYRTISMPGTGKEVIDEAIERAARKEMSLSEEDMYLSWQSIEEHVDKKETDYFVVGVPKTSLNPLLKTLALAKVTPISIDTKPLALARTAASENALIVSLEKNYFDITLVAKGVARVIHSFSPSVNADDTQSIVTELVDGLNKAVKSFYREFPQNALPPETPIFLSGELASDRDMLNQVKEATGHPTGIIKSTEETPAEMPIKLFAANIGLALKNERANVDKSQNKDININLLSSIRKQPKREFKIVYAVAALVFVICAAGVYYTYNLRAGAEDRVASLQQRSTQLAAQLKDAQKVNKDDLAGKQNSGVQLQTITDQISEVKKNSNQISGLKRDYAFRITYILSKLPQDANYSTLEMQAETISVVGIINNPVDSVTKEYKNPIGAVKFAEDVAQNDIFKNARVAGIAKGKDDSTSVFTVIISE
jgi:Tfp pilus assembly protein PilN